MRFTVLWVPEAENELARLWNDDSDASAVSAAADEWTCACKWIRNAKESRGPAAAAFFSSLHWAPSFESFLRTASFASCTSGSSKVAVDPGAGDMTS